MREELALRNLYGRNTTIIIRRSLVDIAEKQPTVRATALLRNRLSVQHAALAMAIPDVEFSAVHLHRHIPVHTHIHTVREFITCMQHSQAQLEYQRHLFAIMVLIYSPYGSYVCGAEFEGIGG